jgi:hypothetical protein
MSNSKGGFPARQRPSPTAARSSTVLRSPLPGLRFRGDHKAARSFSIPVMPRGLALKAMGLDAALDRFWAAADARRLGVDSIQVVTDDGPHGERRRIADIRRDVYSVSKTMTSLAIGMLESDGALNLDDPVLTHLPELADTAATGTEKMTVAHLLRMTAGNGYRWADDDADHPGDPARDFLATPLVAEPGTVYHYGGGNTYVLGRIVHSISGRDLRDFLLPRLFAPSASAIPSGTAAPSASPSERSASSSGPRKSPASRGCSCTKAPTTASAWSHPATSPECPPTRPTPAAPNQTTGPTACTHGAAPATAPGAWTASTASSGSQRHRPLPGTNHPDPRLRVGTHRARPGIKINFRIIPNGPCPPHHRPHDSGPGRHRPLG